MVKKLFQSGTRSVFPGPLGFRLQSDSMRERGGRYRRTRLKNADTSISSHANLSKGSQRFR
jgi:hypothetical protein